MGQDDDFEHGVDDFLSEVLEAGDVPLLPSFLGEEWDPVADTVADLLRRFARTMVIEVARPDGTEVYAQFAREGDDILAEVVSNEFLDATNLLLPERISTLLGLGWAPPTDPDNPNFSKLFADPDNQQLAWVVLQTLHDVYRVRPDDVWSVSPAHLADGEACYGDDDEALEALDPSEVTVLEGGPLIPEVFPEVDDRPDVLETFQMPNAVTIIGRSSSVTNSFANSIIPVVMPTAVEVREALDILGMSKGPFCAYCGDPWTEWDHLRPIIINKAPTGYISEIHNLVPACGKCNQSKGNRHWRTWMFSKAKKSPKTRGVPDLEERANRLAAYEAWKAPTKLDFEAIVGRDDWQAYWRKWVAILELMQTATQHATSIRARVAAAHAGSAKEPPVGEAPAAGEVAEPVLPTGIGTGGWVVKGPEGVVGPVAKNRAVLEAVRAYVSAGGNPEALVTVLGASNFRSVAGLLTGPELWTEFAKAHGRAEHHRRLWYLDVPIHASGRTWVLANNVWGPSTKEVLRELSTASGGAVQVIAPNGSRLRMPDTGEGLIVLKPGQAPPPPRVPRRRRRQDPSDGTDPAPKANGPETTRSRSQAQWTHEDRLILHRLVTSDRSWSRFVDGPLPGLGARGLRIAADLLDRGGRVAPAAEDEVGDLKIELGDRRLLAIVNDYGEPDDWLWARLVETIGPYPDSSATDRTLADFSVHGPFERTVVRRDGWVWVDILVRLTDVSTALQDLDNVTMSLRSALEASSGGTSA